MLESVNLVSSILLAQRKFKSTMFVVGLSIDCSPWVEQNRISYHDMLDRNWAHWTTFCMVSNNRCNNQSKSHCSSRMSVGLFMSVAGLAYRHRIHAKSQFRSTRTWIRYCGITLRRVFPPSLVTCPELLRRPASYFVLQDNSLKLCKSTRCFKIVFSDLVSGLGTD